MSDTQTAMVIEAVTHYKRKLLRHANDEKGDVVLHCLAKLDRVPMTIEILQETGVGRVVNQLKKSTDPDSQIADEAKNIVRKWKDIVQSQEEEEERMNVDQQPEDSNRSANTEEDAHTSSGPEDLELAKSVPQDDSGSDIGPPTLEPQIDSPPSKRHKSSKDSSSSKDRKRDKDSSEKSRDSKSHKSKKRDDDGKHKSHRDDKSHSKSEREKKHIKDEKNKEHRSKSKSSKSSSELKISRDVSKDHDHRKNGYAEKNGISKSSSSHHRDKSSESNHTSSSSNNTKKKERSKDKDRQSNASQKISSEDKGMFESAMLGADDLPTHKKTSKSKSTSGEFSSSFNSNSYAQSTNGKMNGESTNGNSLVNSVNVPKDINPNYKPMVDNYSERTSDSSTVSSRHQVKIPTFDSETYSGKKKTGMTRVYSGAGRKSGYTEVPKLYDMCILVLQENVDSIDECGGLSYDILEPILLRAKPHTLMNIEDHNEYLLEDTVQLWEKHCKKEFPKEERKVEECETWREMYERCSQEKADKFERLTLKAKNSYKQLKTDSRSTKLWDKRGGAKPPRDIKIRQERNGTAFNAPSNALSKGGRPSLMDPTRASSSAPKESSRPSVASAPKKPKTAPLMAKTMKLARGLSRGGGFRR